MEKILHNIGPSECVSIVCALITLIAMIVIAIFQCVQNNKMAKFEKRQDQRDEERHKEIVKSQAVQFISKYYADRGLIPLCAIASMYNELFFYSRDMYREYCCFTKEVQNTVLNYLKLDLRVKDIDIFELCLEKLEEEKDKKWPNDRDLFYDRAKYIERSITLYGKEIIPYSDFKYSNRIANVLLDDEVCNPIANLFNEYNFSNVSEIEACKFAATVAMYIAINSEDNEENLEKNYGSPGEYAGETIDTMEDLFLKVLFEIYTRLVLDKI